LNKKQWLKLVVIGIIGGSAPFLLFFKGLSLTATVNAAFIHKTLFIWVALLAIPFLKEKISSFQLLSFGTLLLGVYLFIRPENLTFGLGELLVFLATFLWAVENVIAKVTLREVKPLIVAWGRMFFGSIILLTYILLSGGISQLVSGSGIQIVWLLLSGLILFGYVVTWYSALKFAPATVVSAVLVIAAPITAVLNMIFVTQQIKASLIIPSLLIGLSVFVISRLFGRLKLVKKSKLSWMGS
jgi:drug/metabolite transporter (DMT)-like permease